MYNELSAAVRSVIKDKATEHPFSGEYDDFYEEGVYLCRRCNTELYRFDAKFDAHCGWPAFEREIPGAVRQLPDRDGVRIAAHVLFYTASYGIRTARPVG